MIFSKPRSGMVTAMLALPVRSLQSSFKWVTCPQALQRFARTAERLGLQLKWPTITQPAPDKALGQGDTKLFLEEFRFEQSPDACIGALAKALAPLSGGALDEATLVQRLVVVHDDIFSFLARNATSVQPHIAIDSTTKTVKDGALWFEETLPPETLLYVPLTATASRRKGGALTATQVLAQFEQLLPAGKNWLQLGGNETTGMGWCRVGIARASAEQGV